MPDIIWKIARTQAELDAAQRIRFQCLEELRIPLPEGSYVRRDIGSVDSLPTTHHVLVFAGGEPAATARLCLWHEQELGVDEEKLGFELGRVFDLGALLPWKRVVGELGRYLARPDRSTLGGPARPRIAALLYNTGARVSEALALTPADVQGAALRPRQVRVHGKGNKDRSCSPSSRRAMG